MKTDSTNEISTNLLAEYAGRTRALVVIVVVCSGPSVLNFCTVGRRIS